MVEGGERGCSTVKASREAQTVVAGEGGDVQSGRGGGRAVLDRSSVGTSNPVFLHKMPVRKRRRDLKS